MCIHCHTVILKSDWMVGVSHGRVFSLSRCNVIATEEFVVGASSASDINPL